MYVCICHAVTERTLDAAILAGARTEDDIGDLTRAGTGCGGCVSRICDRLSRADLQRDSSEAVRLSA